MAAEREELVMLNGDIVGYSRLMAADEEQTIARLSALRDAVGVAVVANHGRLVDFVGDNFLAEFGVVAHALACALEIQSGNRPPNEGLPPEQQMLLRLGLHVGEVRVDGERLYGHAVNVAARLEGVAEPGGICMSQSVRERLGGQLGIHADDLGPHAFRNLPAPVHCWRIASSAIPDSLTVPVIPSLAVLPFACESGDGELAALADAATIDLIRTLSCDRRVSVIAYNSVMTLPRGRDPWQSLPDTLASDFLVVGSLTSRNGRLVFDVELREAGARQPLLGVDTCSERTGVFDALDDIAARVTEALGRRLGLPSGRAYRRRRSVGVDAWMFAIQAAESYLLDRSRTLAESFALARRAVELEPRYAGGWASLGYLCAIRVALGRSDEVELDTDESLLFTDRALKLDPIEPWNLVARAVALQYAGRTSESMQPLQRALRMNASDIVAHAYYGRGLVFTGKPAIALAHFDRSMRLNPNDPGAYIATMFRASALSFLGRWGEAESAARVALARSGETSPWCLVYLLIAVAAQGRTAEAQALLGDLRRLAPHWDRAFVEQFLGACQEDPALLGPLLEHLRGAWPQGESGAG